MTEIPDPIPPAELLAHAGFLRGLARALVRGEDAEDLTQEVWIRALDRPPCRPITLRAWLARVARNLAFNATKARCRREAREAAAARPEAGPSALDEAVARERFRLLTGAVLRLPEPFLGALLLRYYQGASHEEIARRQGVTPATARTRVHRALAKLREELDQAHGGSRGKWLEGIAALALPGALESQVAAVMTGTGGVSAAWILGGLTMKKAIVAAGVLLGALGLVLFLVIHAPGHGGPMDGSRPPVDALAAKADRQAAASSVYEASRVRVETGEADPEAFAPGETDAILASIPKDPVLRILVVAEADGCPVPGAEVAWRCDELEAPGMEIYPGVSLLSPEEYAFDGGRRLLADEEGAVSIPRLPWKVLVGARHAKLSGAAEFQPEEPSPARLLLGAVRQVVIQVVDGQENPKSGIPVGLVAAQAATWPSVDFFWKGLTAGSEGTALARFPPERISVKDLVAAFQFPVTGGVPVAVDPERPGPARLVLPPAGRIVARLLDPTGLPYTGPAAVRLGLSFEHDSLGINDEAEAPAREGVALFPCMGLGRMCWLSALAPEQGFAWGSDDSAFPGPAAPGEEVVIPLQARQVSGPFRGRMLDEQGRPLPGIVVCAWADIYTNESISASTPLILKTDKAGRFALRTRVPGRAKAVGLRFTRWLRTGPRGLPLGPWATALALSPFPFESKELGDVILEGEVPVVAGVVRNTDGKPVPQAGVYLQRHPPDRMGPGGQPAPWHISQTTDATGCFFFTVHETELMQVQPCKGWSRIVPYRQVLPGARNVELVLGDERSGSIEVRLLLDPGLPAVSIRVHGIRKTETSEESNFLSHRGGGPEGEIYRGDDFWPGLYTLVVTSGQTLAMVEGIEVRAGEVARDPRVSPLDLSGRLRLLRFRVESEAGFPIQKIDFVVEEDKVPTRRSRDALAGRYEILARAGSTRFAVGAYGFRPVQLSWFPEEQKVVLRPGIRVRFRSVPKGDMEDPRPGLAGLHSLGLSWIYEGPSGPGIEADLLRHLGRGSHWNLDGRDIVLELPFPGRYRLSLQADLYRPTKNMRVDLPRSSPGVVVVEDREGEQVLELRFDEAELLEARRRAAKE